MKYTLVMLVNCPRCNFSQPKDQYCAQCGVDMQAFRPKETPLFSKIIDNVFFQVGLLVVAAAIVGQKIYLSNNEPQRWVQKISRVQTVTKSSVQQNEMINQNDSSSTSNTNSGQLSEMYQREIEVAAAQEQPISAAPQPPTPAAAPASTTALAASGVSADATSAHQSSSATFKIIFAEVPRETLNKWITEATAAGAFMNLPEYSAGIIADFRKKGDDFQVLKVTEKKLGPGQSDTQFSGSLLESTNQMIGFVTAIDHRITDDSGVHGTLTVTRSQRQNKETFPAEFDLPKGAVFLMVGLIRRPTFQADREMLTMPPFQIFKSNDYMTQKTEFVFILEPEYK